jgi:hypothetical protein
MEKSHEEKDIEATARAPSSGETHDLKIGEIKDFKLDKNQDAALEFLRGGEDVRPMTVADEKALLRKIDWRIMPLMFGCYTLRMFSTYQGAAKSLAALLYTSRY